MLKKIIVSLLATLMIIVSAVSCAADTADQNLIAETFQSLEQMATQGIAEIDGNLNKIYQDLYEIDLSLLKLEQVTNPAQEWIEHQKGLDQSPGKWLISVESEALEQFKNDQYQITKLEITVTDDGTQNKQFSSEIIAVDMLTGSTGNIENLYNDLIDKQKSLENNAEKKLEEREQLASAMEAIIAGGGVEWEIQKIDKSNYIIKSNDLGWADKLTAGTWKYNMDTKTLEPADSGSATLKKLLLASL